MTAGYAGLDNELFYLDKTMMVFGDVKKVVEDMVNEVDWNWIAISSTLETKKEYGMPKSVLIEDRKIATFRTPHGAWQARVRRKGQEPRQ